LDSALVFFSLEAVKKQIDAVISTALSVEVDGCIMKV